MVMLFDRYQEKLNQFQELGKLSQDMAEFTSDQLMTDDAAGARFLNLLDLRTVLINQIEDHSGVILTLEKEGKPEELQSVKLIKRSLREEMMKIRDRNEIIESLLKGSLNQLREEAQKLQEGKQSNRAYVARVPFTEGSFIDKRR